MIVNGIRFEGLKRQLHGTSTGRSGDYFIKIEDERHPQKRLGIREEAALFRKLNEKKLVSVPELLHEGEVEGRGYFITRHVNHRRGMRNADALLAFLEVKGAGVIHGDLRKPRKLSSPREGNVLFNGLYCELVDFDQAIEDSKVAKMELEELFSYLHAEYPDWERQVYPLSEQLRCFKYESQMTGGRLDLALTTLMRKGVTTAANGGIYHDLQHETVFVKGERGLSERLPILKKIDFEGEDILDVGCNTGLLVRYLIARGAKSVDGFEYSSEHALVGQMVNHCEGIFHAHIRQHDLGKTPIQKQYDTVMLFSVIHHIENMAFAMNQVSSHTKRIVIECRLKETGYAYSGWRWKKTNAWCFQTLEELSAYLSDRFGFRFNKNYGAVDRDRFILEFVRD